MRKIGIACLLAGMLLALSADVLAVSTGGFPASPTFQTVTVSAQVKGSGVGVSNSVYKNIATNRTSTTTLTADPDLAMSLNSASGGRWFVEMKFDVSAVSSGTPDFQFALSGTNLNAAGSRLLCVMGLNQASGAVGTAALVARIDATPVVAQINMVGPDIWIVYCSGTVITTAAAGSVALTWAQVVSDPTQMSVFQGSLTALRIF